MSRTHLITALVLLGLTACTTTDDPSKGGFLSGMKNLSDGTYQARVDDRQKTLENEQDTKARFAAFNAELNTLRQRLAKAEVNNSQKKNQVATLTKEIDALETRARMVQQDTFTPDAERQKRLDALKVERDALDREIDLLLRR